MSYTRFAVACALGLVLVAFPAGSTPIPVTIEGRAEANVYVFDVAGDNLHFRISTAEGPYVVGLCGAGPCSVVQDYSGGVQSTQFGMTALLNGVSSHQTSGTIQLAFDIVPGPEQRFTAVVPLTITGDITAYGEFPFYPELFRFAFAGSGPATAFGLIFEDGRSAVQGVRFTVPGTAEIVPEPGTVALLASGLLGLALRRRGR